MMAEGHAERSEASIFIFKRQKRGEEQRWEEEQRREDGFFASLRMTENNLQPMRTKSHADGRSCWQKVMLNAVKHPSSSSKDKGGKKNKGGKMDSSLRSE
ncbi:MAG: hypothetical protein LBU06_07990 [Desulfovibrio sp.]|jgi:hypothetical protein|nr:hypothetical protein [Desulfovibrio sp.]